MVFHENREKSGKRKRKETRNGRFEKCKYIAHRFFGLLVCVANDNLTKTPSLRGCLFCSVVVDTAITPDRQPNSYSP